jgi:hypothetical protein
VTVPSVSRFSSFLCSLLEDLKLLPEEIVLSSLSVFPSDHPCKYPGLLHFCDEIIIGSAALLLLWLSLIGKDDVRGAFVVEREANPGPGGERARIPGRYVNCSP